MIAIWKVADYPDAFCFWVSLVVFYDTRGIERCGLHNGGNHRVSYKLINRQKGHGYTTIGVESWCSDNLLLYNITN